MKTTLKERCEIINRLDRVGIPYTDAQKLRRISMTLQRWFEMECGTENAAGSSISIERDDNGEGRPFMRVQFMQGNQWVDRKYPVADRENGARKRLAAIMAKYPKLSAYVQTDCRGCAVYILRQTDFMGQPADQAYSRGIAVY